MVILKLAQDVERRRRTIIRLSSFTYRRFIQGHLLAQQHQADLRHDHRTGILDSFNRSDGNLAAPWTFVLGSFALSNNQCKGNTTSFNDALYKTSIRPDFEVYATIATKPGDGGMVYLGGRFDESRANGYFIRFMQSAGVDYLRMYLQQNTTETQLGSTVYQELNPGDSLGMSMVGSTMTLWYKPVGGAWSSLATARDSTLTAAGYLYLDVTGDVARIDDFGGGTPPPRTGARAAGLAGGCDHRVARTVG